MNWQISEFVGFEVSLFLKAVQLGMETFFLYDLIRIFRRVILHNMAGEIVEDILYWIVIGYKMYFLLITENGGGLRFYIILGMCLGGLLYFQSIGKYFVKNVSQFLVKIKCRILNLFRKARRKAQIPVIKVKNRYQTFQNWADIKRRRKILQIKNKLTHFYKMLKIVLFKQ